MEMVQAGVGKKIQRSNSGILIILVVTIVAYGWSSLLVGATGKDPTENASAPDSQSGPLDGMIFTGALGPDGKPKDIPDSFVFENGAFVSKECELRCKYPARPYFVRVNGTRTEFISETKCPYKDAKIVWRGTIEGDTIKGKSTWIVKRWYWTVENTFEFEGKLIEKPASTTTTE
jgi:hypothetical protein